MKNKKLLYSLLTILLCVFCFQSFAEEVRIAFFGTGKRIGKTETYSEKDLKALLQKIAQEKPNAVVFDGDLIQGLEQNTSLEGFNTFKKNLERFSLLFKENLGAQVPLYPIMGNHTFVNTEAVKIFREHFQLDTNIPLEPYQFAYTKELGRVKMVLLATGLYETAFRNPESFSKTMPLLDWLEKTIRSSQTPDDVCFVISHEPAFSPRAAEGVYSGIDSNNEQRDRFWGVLKTFRARAHFCSHEPMYDRSHHRGIWQLISGGLVNTQGDEENSTRFLHFLLVTVPANTQQQPKIKAIDLYGKTWDEFELLPVGEAVQHLRISQN